ncbi:MAG: AAA family ATPase [Eubacterium sp.]|nr:AAA family ATPase [Eubacterium sp.]
MVIIITGASHAGKTLLAQKLLEKYKYPYMSIDHLKMGLIRSGNTDLTPEDDDKLTEYLWPIIREIIKTVIENEQNLIVEGCYVPPDWRNSFDESYLMNIQFICLAMTEDYIDKHYNEIIKHESDIESRMIEADCTEEELRQSNRWFIEAFTQAGEKIVIIDEDFEEAIERLRR